MIVKQNSYRVPSSTLYGVAGGVFGLVTIGFMIQSQLAPETYPGCSERYANAGMFALQGSSGALLGSAELQSKLAGREWGVLHNVAVKPDNAPASPVAMVVHFKPGGRLDHNTRQAPSGVGFRWQPGYLQQASAACLSYAVHLPAKFKFAQGGTLPGLFGNTSTARPDDKEAFSTRMRWLPKGRVGVQAVLAHNRSGSPLTLSDSWLKIPRGEWVQIEQEVVLNAPGQRDGKLRIWINGRLHLNQDGVLFRKQPNESFSGVIADTHYAGREMQWQPAPQATHVKLSPMIVRWN